MDESILERRLDFEAAGYFGCLLPSAHSEKSPSLSSDPWLSWEYIIHEAMRGRFDHFSRVASLFRDANNYVLQNICEISLGNAGTLAAIASIEEDVLCSQDTLLKISYCSLLASSGWLATIPLILRIYRDVRHFNDSDIVTVRLSDLLEKEPGSVCLPASNLPIERYSGLVMDRYEVLKARFGTDRIAVFEGEVFSVENLAGSMLKHLRDNTFEPEHRQKFEAATGLDCSGFYQKRILQPLTAAALIERFLESGQASKYLPGVRYFFGHRIPDSC